MSTRKFHNERDGDVVNGIKIVNGGGSEELVVLPSFMKKIGSFLSSSSVINPYVYACLSSNSR